MEINILLCFILFGLGNAQFYKMADENNVLEGSSYNYLDNQGTKHSFIISLTSWEIFKLVVAIKLQMTVINIVVVTLFVTIPGRINGEKEQINALTRTNHKLSTCV